VLKPTPAKVFIVRLAKWFPLDDPLAVKVARLCIIREDMMLEMRNILLKETEEEDETSFQRRRTYFLRNLVRSLMELSSAIHRRLNDSAFKALVVQQPANIQQQFANAEALIADAQPVARAIRNDICAHVLESAVQEAIEQINPDSFGLLDFGPLENLTSYGFAHELIAAMLMKDVPDDHKRDLDFSKFKKIGEFIKLFALIEQCLIIYVHDRKLLPLRDR